MDEGHIVVDSIERIRLADITGDLARESGFSSVKDLLQIAKHGRGDNISASRPSRLADGFGAAVRLSGTFWKFRRSKA